MCFSSPLHLPEKEEKKSRPNWMYCTELFSISQELPLFHNQDNTSPVGRISDRVSPKTWGPHPTKVTALEIFRREGLHRRIARRIQYALSVVEKPSSENRPRGCVILSPWCDSVLRYMLKTGLRTGMRSTEATKPTMIRTSELPHVQRRPHDQRLALCLYNGHP